MLQSIDTAAVSGLTIQNGVVLACNGIGLKNMLQAGAKWLEVHKDVVNGLNVFPVPDGDTGTNMVLTMRAALDEIEQADNHNVSTIASAVAHGALVGARGNSGVILSQFLQGVAIGLKGKVTFTADELAHAVELGTKHAYESVMEPVEGTILTIARAASEAASRSVQSNQDLGALLYDIVKAARTAQANTPELLPTLKEAGVTDSGGQGLLYILEGCLRFLNDEPFDLDLAGDPAPVLQSTVRVDEQTYGFDVQFLLAGEHLRVKKIRADMGKLGRSTVVVGDENLVKVHVHVDDPTIPLDYAAKLGTLRDVVIENLEEQAKAFIHQHAAPVAHAVSTGHLTDELRGANITIIAVVAGEGLVDIFDSLGVGQIVPGGQTMNPSTQALLNAVEQIEANNVLILPNNSNIILAAQQVQKLTAKNVGVIPTKNIPQGIAALLAFNNQVDFNTNARRMLHATLQVHTLEITRATRPTTLNGLDIKKGDVVALLNHELAGAAQNDYEAALAGLTQIKVDDYEIMTIYYGGDSSQAQADALADKIKAHYPDLEVEIYYGGQPHYYYIISLE